METTTKKTKTNSYRVPTTRTGLAKYRAVQARYKELSEQSVFVGGVECKLRFSDKLEILKQEYFYEHDSHVMRVLNTELPPEEEE
jgi:hypothetical protein